MRLVPAPKEGWNRSGRWETVAGTFVGDYITGEDGNFTVTNLEPGWYRACETKTLSGYKLDKTPQTVELVSGKTAEHPAQPEGHSIHGEAGCPVQLAQFQPGFFRIGEFQPGGLTGFQLHGLRGCGAADPAPEQPHHP